MTFSRSDVPEHLIIRITQQSDPVSAVTEDDAWRALDAYPQVVAVGPVFGLAELDPAAPGVPSPRHWRLLTLGDTAPQAARDALSARLERLARESDDRAAREKYTAAAHRVAREGADEVTVAAGHRYRVVRAEQFARMGPDGPEPPRPTDPDAAATGDGHRVPARTTGFVLDPAAPTGPSDGLLRLELLPVAPAAGEVPERVRAEAAMAVQTHPGGVLLPTEFAVAEEVDGRWQTLSGSNPSPQSARDALAHYFRHLLPDTLRPGEEARARYGQAADRLDAERCDEITVLGRRFRVVRVEQLVRVGHDGPEPPRGCDDGRRTE